MVLQNLKVKLLAYIKEKNNNKPSQMVAELLNLGQEQSIAYLETVGTMGNHHL